MSSTIDLEQFEFEGQWSFSNTIYPTQENFHGIISQLICHHGRKITLDEVDQINFKHYQISGNDTGFEVFLAQYSTVFHMWGLYYLDSNGIFFITPLALQFFKGEIDYQKMNIIFSARTQFPKPQVFRQPDGPLRPVIALIRVFKSLAAKGKDEWLTDFEVNLFGCYINADNKVEEFVAVLLLYRTDNSLIPKDAVPSNRASNGISGILRIAKVANIIEKQSGCYQLVRI